MQLADQSLQEPPILWEDPYSVETLGNPYPFQALVRDAGPVVRLGKYEIYASGRHDEVQAIMKNWADFRSAGGVGIQDIRKPGKFRIPSAIVEVDPPDHTGTRAAMVKILSPLKVRQWREGFERAADTIAERVLDQGTFDGVTDVAEPFIFSVFPKAMGLDIPRKEALVIAEMRFNQSGPPNELYQAAMKQAEPYLAWFDGSCKRAAALPGGVADEIFQAADEGKISLDIAENLVRTLVGGGTDTTIAGIGFTLRYLAENPRQWDIVRADPSRIRGAFEEALRLEAPSQFVYRTTHQDMEFAGYQLKGGTKLAMCLGAANRDPRKWPDPDQFDVTRETTGVHLAFGNSTHVCLGQMLARLEAETILAAIVKRARALEPAGAPAHRLMNQVRALRNLPLRVMPA